jgi:uncharacterized membrane protein
MWERSFVLGGTQFAFCSRCTGFYGGLFFGALIISFMRGKKSLGLWSAILLVIPAFIDFWFDLSSFSPVPNTLRCLTGLAAALGVIWFVLPRLLFAVER